MVSRARERLGDTTQQLPRSRRTSPTPDARVGAVLDVLAGVPATEVALRHAIDVALLRRWVRAFVDSGTATVTNRPDPAVARQRDRFLASFAHELRTPLAVAKGWSTILAEEASEETGLAVERIGTALDEMTERLVEAELLVASSLGRLRLDHETLTVDDLVAGLPDVPDVRGLGGGVTLEVDRTTARVVLRDLWKAAALHPTPQRRWVEVNRVAQWVEVRVVRTAAPIEPAVLTALFEPFDRNADDTGVTTGLYLARAIAVAHGGMVGAEQDDDRASFWVRFPRHAPNTEEDA
jgi:signal transduction histidine kinase